MSQELDEAVKRFEEKLNKGAYRKPKVPNNEPFYSEEKAERDTKAVEEFAKSDSFKQIMKDL